MYLWETGAPPWAAFGREKLALIEAEGWSSSEHASTARPEGVMKLGRVGIYAGVQLSGPPTKRPEKYDSSPGAPEQNGNL